MEPRAARPVLQALPLPKLPVQSHTDNGLTITDNSGPGQLADIKLPGLRRYRRPVQSNQPEADLQRAAIEEYQLFRRAKGLPAAPTTPKSMSILRPSLKPGHYPTSISPEHQLEPIPEPKPVMHVTTADAADIQSWAKREAAQQQQPQRPHTANADPSASLDDSASAHRTPLPASIQRLKEWQSKKKSTVANGACGIDGQCRGSLDAILMPHLAAANAEVSVNRGQPSPNSTTNTDTRAITPAGVTDDTSSHTRRAANPRLMPCDLEQSLKDLSTFLSNAEACAAPTPQSGRLSAEPKKHAACSTEQDDQSETQEIIESHMCDPAMQLQTALELATAAKCRKDVVKLASKQNSSSSSLVSSMAGASDMSSLLGTASIPDHPVTTTQFQEITLRSGSDEFIRAPHVQGADGPSTACCTAEARAPATDPSEAPRVENTISSPLEQSSNNSNPSATALSAQASPLLRAASQQSSEQSQEGSRHDPRVQATVQAVFQSAVASQPVSARRASSLASFSLPSNMPAPSTTWNRSGSTDAGPHDDSPRALRLVTSLTNSPRFACSEQSKDIQRLSNELRRPPDVPVVKGVTYKSMSTPVVSPSALGGPAQMLNMFGRDCSKIGTVVDVMGSGAPTCKLVAAPQAEDDLEIRIPAETETPVPDLGSQISLCRSLRTTPPLPLPSPSLAAISATILPDESHQPNTARRTAFQMDRPRFAGSGAPTGSALSSNAVARGLPDSRSHHGGNRVCAPEMDISERLNHGGNRFCAPGLKVGDRSHYGGNRVGPPGLKASDRSHHGGNRFCPPESSFTDQLHHGDKRFCPPDDSFTDWGQRPTTSGSLASTSLPLVSQDAHGPTRNSTILTSSGSLHTPLRTAISWNVAHLSSPSEVLMTGSSESSRPDSLTPSMRGPEALLQPGGGWRPVSGIDTKSSPLAAGSNDVQDSLAELVTSLGDDFSEDVGGPGMYSDVANGGMGAHKGLHLPKWLRRKKEKLAWEPRASTPSAGSERSSSPGMSLGPFAG